MKKILTLCFSFSLIMLLSGCCFPHTWVEATCEQPKTCSKCGAREGEPLGHTWVAATCEQPKTCSVCGKTEGEPLDHTEGDWEETKKAEPGIAGERVKKCSVCGTVLKTEAVDALPIIQDGSFAVSPATFAECLRQSLNNDSKQMASLKVNLTVEESTSETGVFHLEVKTSDQELVSSIIFKKEDGTNLTDKNENGFLTISITEPEGLSDDGYTGNEKVLRALIQLLHPSLKPDKQDKIYTMLFAIQTNVELNVLTALSDPNKDLTKSDMFDTMEEKGIYYGCLNTNQCRWFISPSPDGFDFLDKIWEKS